MCVPRCWGTGGANRIRTCGLLCAKQALFQLSYSPTRRDLYCARRRMVEDAGIEPAYVLFPKQETLLESDPRY
jgi:hypothetical protein